MPITVSAAPSTRNPSGASCLAMRSSTCAIGRFGNSQTVCVILDTHQAPKNPLQVLVQGLAVHPGGIGVFHQSGGRGECTGDADTDRGAGSGLGGSFGNQISDRLQGGLIIVTRGGDAVTENNGVVTVEHRNLDLRPAQIDPYFEHQEYPRYIALSYIVQQQRSEP